MTSLKRQRRDCSTHRPAVRSAQSSAVAATSTGECFSHGLRQVRQHEPGICAVVSDLSSRLGVLPEASTDDRLKRDNGAERVVREAPGLDRFTWWGDTKCTSWEDR